MLKINEKTFLNIQEAVQWLMDNNALPFQCTANYAANTEIGLGTIVNPTMAKVRIGSIVFFTDSKASTVTGVSSTGFTVSDQYIDLANDVRYISSVEIIANGLLSVTFSDGSVHTAGLIKMCTSFAIDSSQHLIAYFNDNTQVDLGAIFQGNVTISGDLSVSGDATIGGDISGSGNVLATGKFLGDGVEIKTIDDIAGQGYVDVLKPLRISTLTSANNEIVTSKPIVETLYGYEYIPAASGTNITKEIVYAGIAKNGNKLTFVVCANLTKTATISQQGEELCKFYVPLDIGAKLIPTQIGIYSFLDVRQCLLSSNQISGIIKPGYIEKNGAQYLRIFVVLDDNLVTDRKYYVRYEVTFLLGENLAA